VKEYIFSYQKEQGCKGDAKGVQMHPLRIPHFSAVFWGFFEVFDLEGMQGMQI